MEAILYVAQNQRVLDSNNQLEKAGFFYKKKLDVRVLKPGTIL